MPDSHIDSTQKIPVWDLPVRLIHWANILLLIALITTGLLGNEWLVWHMRAGTVLLTLVLFRITWGFAGSRNARFTVFLYGPAAIASYLRSLFAPPHQAHASHNPLGGWMVVLLLLSMLFQAMTGLFTNDEIMYEGPLTSHVLQSTSNLLSSIHRQFWWVIIALAALHIAAVFSYLVFLRENLIQAMVTGRKQLPSGDWAPEHARHSMARALILLVIVVALGAWLWR